MHRVGVLPFFISRLTTPDSGLLQYARSVNICVLAEFFCIKAPSLQQSYPVDAGQLVTSPQRFPPVILSDLSPG
jgi:hypothetical protein